MWGVYNIVNSGGGSYVGSTADALARLYEHNHGKCEATRGKRWELLFWLPIGERSEAYLVERWLKTGNTRAKRENLRLMLENSGETFAASQALRAAHEWNWRRSGLTRAEYAQRTLKTNHA